MTDVFLKILSMSLTASYCVLIICIARIFLRRAPRIFSYLLWSVVAVRLLLPVSLETSFSLVGRGMNDFAEQVAEGSFFEIFGTSEETESESGGQFWAQTEIQNQTEAQVGIQTHAEAQAGIQDQNQQIHAETQAVIQNQNQQSQEDAQVGIQDQNQQSQTEAQADTQAQSLTTDQMQPQAMSGTDSAEPTVETEEAGTTQITHTALVSPNPSNGYDTILQIAAYVWLAGVVTLFGYCIVSYIWLSVRLGKKAYYAFDYKRRPVYRVRGLETPFVLGLIRPSIYIPEELVGDEVGQCLAHEHTHIRRKDYLIKQFAFLLACVYWFQLLIWLAYFLMVRDMEISCDEMALRRTDLEGRKVYSNALVQMAGRVHVFSGYPVAFGTGSTSARVKHILKLKKPAMWVLTVCVLFLAVCMAGLLTDPVANSQMSQETGKKYYGGHGPEQPEQLDQTQELQGKSEGLSAERFTALQRHDVDYAQLLEERLAAEQGVVRIDTSLYRECPNVVQWDDYGDVLQYPMYFTVTAESLEVRSMPKDNAEVWGTLLEGDLVQILAFGDALQQKPVLFQDKHFKEFFLSDPEILEDSQGYALVFYNYCQSDHLGWRLSPYASPCRTGYVKLDGLEPYGFFNDMYDYGYFVAKTWVEAFSRRDGELLYRMAADKNAFSKWEYVNGVESTDPLQVDFGREENWPSELYCFSVSSTEENVVNIQYFVVTEDSLKQVWRQDIEIVFTEEEMDDFTDIDQFLEGSVRFSDITVYEQIDNYSDFRDAYLTVNPISADYILYAADRSGDLHRYQQDATYKSPQTAAEAYLNLIGGTAKVCDHYELVDGHIMPANRDSYIYPRRNHWSWKNWENGLTEVVYVDYTFAGTDEGSPSSVSIPLYQEQGYWYIDPTNFPR